MPGVCLDEGKLKYSSGILYILVLSSVPDTVVSYLFRQKGDVAMLITTETEAVKVRFKDEDRNKEVRVAHATEYHLRVDVHDTEAGPNSRFLLLTASEMKAIAAAAALLEV